MASSNPEKYVQLWDHLVIYSSNICTSHSPRGAGSGKTTLLDFLADRKAQNKTQKLEGQIKINGKPRDASFRHYAAYIQQEDTLVGSLTVRETFMFSAVMTMKNSSPSERQQAVDQIIQTLGLTVCKGNSQWLLYNIQSHCILR